MELPELPNHGQTGPNEVEFGTGGGRLPFPHVTLSPLSCAGAATEGRSPNSEPSERAAAVAKAPLKLPVYVRTSRMAWLASATLRTMATRPYSPSQRSPRW